MTTRETEGWKLEDVSERVSKVKRRLKMDSKEELEALGFNLLDEEKETKSTNNMFEVNIP